MKRFHCETLSRECTNSEERAWKKMKLDHEDDMIHRTSLINLKKNRQECEECESVMTASYVNHVKCLHDLLNKFKTSEDTQSSENSSEATKEALLCAIGQGHLHCVKLLLDFNFTSSDSNFLNTIQFNGITPLHICAGGGHVEVLQELINRGADVNLLLPADHLTPLHVCASFGAVACIDVLLANGADPMLQTSDSAMNALHFAAYHGQTECVEAFLRNGCNVNSRSTVTNRTALFFAAKQGHIETFEYLKRNGADLNALDINGSSSLVFAATSRQGVEIARYFSVTERRKWLSVASSNMANPSIDIPLKRDVDFRKEFTTHHQKFYRFLRDALNSRSCLEIFDRIPSLTFSFVDEMGEGLGVSREWFSALCDHLLSNSELFAYSSVTGTYFFSNHFDFGVGKKNIQYLQVEKGNNIYYNSHLQHNDNNKINHCNKHNDNDNNNNHEVKQWFEWCGMLIGLSLVYGHIVPIQFSAAIFKLLLGKKLQAIDMRDIDQDFYQHQYLYVKQCTAVQLESLLLTFTQTENVNGTLVEIELCENGKQIAVTSDNVNEYLELLWQHKLFWNRHDKMEQFIFGFHQIVPANILHTLFTERELQSVMSGDRSVIDVTQWKLFSKYENCKQDEKEIVWLWEIVSSFSDQQKRMLLAFCTGSYYLPYGGFKQLELDRTPFTIQLLPDTIETNQCLPSSRTCFNTLILPRCTSLTALKIKLEFTLFAQQQGIEFGFV